MNREMQLNDVGKDSRKNVGRKSQSIFQVIEVEPFVVMPNHVHGIITIIDG